MDLAFLQELTPVGVLAALVYLIVREILQYAGSKDRVSVSDVYDEVEQLLNAVDKIAEQVDDLHAWHSKEDDDGVKVWYVRRSLETSLAQLSNNIGAQTAVLERLLLETQTTRQTMERLYRESGRGE